MTRSYLRVGHAVLSEPWENHWHYLCRSFSTNETQMSKVGLLFPAFVGWGRVGDAWKKCDAMNTLVTNGYNKSLLELTHFVELGRGSVLSEHGHEGPHSV